MSQPWPPGSNYEIILEVKDVFGALTEHRITVWFDCTHKVENLEFWLNYYGVEPLDQAFLNPVERP